MTQKKIALLGTSDARLYKYNARGELLSSYNPYAASPRLLELLDQGYEVYIVSTRTKFFPDGGDKCLLELIPRENFFFANPELECRGPDSPGLIDVWERAATHVGVEVGDNFETWMDIRFLAKEQGLTIK